jgi:hypothetical protein
MMTSLRGAIMPSQDLGDLDSLLEPLPPNTARLARHLVSVLVAYPGLSGRVTQGWRSVNFHHASAGYICAVLPHDDHIVLHFPRGRQLDDGEGLLLGEAKNGRHLRLRPGTDVPLDAIGLFVAEAIAVSA